MTEVDPPAPETSPGRRGLWRSGKRIAIGVGGFAMILAGVLLSLPFVPGPGFVLIIAGLALLATEFAWAERWLQTARERFEDASRKAGVQPKHAAIAGIAVVVVAAGVGAWFFLR